MKLKDILSAMSCDDARIMYVDENDNGHPFWLSDWRKNSEHRQWDDVEVGIDFMVNVDIMLVNNE